MLGLKPRKKHVLVVKDDLRRRGFARHHTQKTLRVHIKEKALFK